MASTNCFLEEFWWPLICWEMYQLFCRKKRVKKQVATEFFKNSEWFLSVRILVGKPNGFAFKNHDFFVREISIWHQTSKIIIKSFGLAWKPYDLTNSTNVLLQWLIDICHSRRELILISINFGWTTCFKIC